MFFLRRNVLLAPSNAFSCGNEDLRRFYRYIHKNTLVNNKKKMDTAEIFPGGAPGGAKSPLL
jgi:hypothetical protein